MPCDAAKCRGDARFTARAFNRSRKHLRTAQAARRTEGVIDLSALSDENQLSSSLHLTARLCGPPAVKLKIVLLTIGMLIGNLLIRVAVAAAIGGLIWLPGHLLLDFGTRSVTVIFFAVLLPLCGLWECSDMTGLNEKVCLLQSQERLRTGRE